MISAKDVMDFHVPSGEDDNRHWAETNFFGFYNSKEEITIGVYLIFRKQFNLVLSNVFAVKGFGRDATECLHNDYQVYLPIPKEARLGDYSLANGLHVKATKAPMDYDIKYRSEDGAMEIDVHYEGLMPPYDIADPEMDPITKKSTSGELADAQGFGTAYNHHFDQSGRYTGVVKVHGKEYEISEISTMDHSWGPRPEFDAHNMTWGHVHADPDFAIHTIFQIDPNKDPVNYGPLAHGYVMEGGKCYGLVSGTGRALKRDGYQQKELEVEVTDIRGKTFGYKGKALTGYPWQAWPSVCGYQSLNEVVLTDGRKAYGECQDFMAMPYMTRPDRPKF
ncbi:MAG: hypothetical protein COA65_07415 [Rhodospirillaceae bacterium]|nr:MAG: hypothetical protein COA65_07415 [Rhodospirillaceae bacterium]